ncbi:YbaB/EbfC family nucleoid-associated protein [Streptomyces sp. ISID311]|uniref:YbaB/EbfC family nucleoid-associated protein n=1 Tax=Streptomyces sp. ISID311 TaxID=2601673 RepID=UPI0011BD35E4|nr:YbaB/EbfC family nucleoid-associated protein [Streptomyces sp. ISID311]TXC99888.1 YbaB/EbfC family nucleoid-associated protein [Streptomyces sp. ISID311]
MNGTDGFGSSEYAKRSPLAETMEQRIAQAMAELEAVQEGVAKAEEDLREATVTVRSRNRAVEVTVGAQGELIGLKFLDGKYRNLAAAELAASVLESASRARTKMARQVMKTLEPFTQPSAEIPELAGVDVDWSRIFGPAALDDPRHKAGYRRGSKLGDEITEDAEDEESHG